MVPFSGLGSSASADVESGQRENAVVERNASEKQSVVRAEKGYMLRVSNQEQD
jgi:hypothetical protein